MKKALIFLGIAVFALMALAAVKNQLIKSIVASSATTLTGAPTQIESLSLSALKQTIQIKGFKMYNPQGFPKEILVDIPAISVACDLGSLLQKKLHLKQVAFDLKELRVIKNKEGKLNVDSLKVVEQKGSKSTKSETQKPQEQMPVQIDELVLNLGRVVYQDYSTGAQPSVQVYDINIKNKTYKNITNANQLVVLILNEFLKKTAIESAKVYAASTVLGIGFLPAGIAITLLGKDSTQQSFDVSFDKAYEASLSVLTKSGQVNTESKEQGTIKALVNKNDIVVKIEKLTPKTTQVTVKAKRLLLPKPEIAKGILLEISDKLQ